MNPLVGYQCSRCGATYQPHEITYTCPVDGGVLDVQLDYDAIGRVVGPAELAANPDRSLWRYQALLPVDPPPNRLGPLATVGGTPLFAAPRAAERLGLRHLWIKDDGRLPTGSLKDRASAIVAARALEQGIERIVTASTGNAGVAQAAMSNAAGLAGVVLVPESAPPAKIAQLLVFGAELLLVEGNYDAAFELSLQAAEQLGWYCRNTGHNPFTTEGKKTASFEICEQLTAELGPIQPDGRWRAPDRIVVSVGDGNIISGLHKGLRDLEALGWIDRMPRLMGVQAAGSAAVARAFETGADTVTPVVANTIADSIAADRPADGWRALRAARQTDGSFTTVTDDQILAAIVALGRDAAVFAEPAAAAAYAGLVKLCEQGAIDRDEQVVVLVTGNGLKDVAAAQRATTAPPRIEPTVSALEQALAER